MARFKNRQADEHPRPHIDVPMSVFGDFFNRDYALVGELIHHWCHCVWKKDPRVLGDGRVYKPEDLETLKALGYIVVDEDGCLRHTGPRKDPNWLLDQIKSWSTYAIEAIDHGLVKVGKALDPYKRLETLQIGSPHPLRLIGVVAKDIEDRVHKKLWSHWTAGEWFHFNDETRAILAEEGLL